MTPQAPATTSAQALANLQQYQSTEKAPQDILTSQEQSLGVPAAQQQVQGLRGAIQNTTTLLNNVAPSVYGRTQNSLETNAQANANISNEQAPLSATLSKQNTDYGNQESDLQNLLSQSGTLAGLQQQGQTGQENYLQGIYNDLYGKETDSAKLAEQAREANLSASTAAGSAAANNDYLGALLGGSSSGSAPAGNLTGGKTSDQAYSDVEGLLKQNNLGALVSNFGGISKSAGYGNTYDQAKLQILKTLAPGIFNKDGTLNTGFLNRTLGSGMNLF